MAVVDNNGSTVDSGGHGPVAVFIGNRFVAITSVKRTRRSLAIFSGDWFTAGFVTQGTLGISRKYERTVFFIGDRSAGISFGKRTRLSVYVALDRRGGRAEVLVRGRSAVLPASTGRAAITSVKNFVTEVTITKDWDSNGRYSTSSDCTICSLAACTSTRCVELQVSQSTVFTVIGPAGAGRFDSIPRI